MSTPSIMQLAAAVAELDAEIAARLVARRRLLELARSAAGQAPAPPLFFWGFVHRATARQIRHDLIH
ncbi:MAG: hypothetical protein ABI847_04360 [Anaerolineales bacterium]